jgi:hypothetical protein
MTTPHPDPEADDGMLSPGRNLWSLDEYIVVADLYLRRGRSSGVQDPEVRELAQLTGRSPASISRRLGNFDGSARPGMGLKPVAGEALSVFNSMRADDGFRVRAVQEARERLRQQRRAVDVSRQGPRFVDPESVEVEETEFPLSATTGRMVREEAKLVRRYRRWLDPQGMRLRGLIIPTVGCLLRADLFDTMLNVLIEAKAESSRANIRYAIGQLFDYRRYMSPPPELALLLPGPLSGDLEMLLSCAGISVIWESGDAFVDSTGGRLTVQS